MNIVNRLKSIRRDLRSKSTSKYVRQYYNNNKEKKVSFTKNCWSKNYYWDFFYQSLPNGVNTDMYVPYDYYSSKIEPIMNSWYSMNNIRDKNTYDLIFSSGNVFMPRTIFRYMNNILMDHNYVPLKNLNEVLTDEKCDLLVKQSIDSHGGSGILKYEFRNNKFKCNLTEKELTLEGIKSQIKKDFIVQEFIEQEPSLSRLYPFSVNTIKLISYRSVKDNSTNILAASIRTGRNHAIVDNMAKGGIMIGMNIVEDRAFLKELWFDTYGNYGNEHPDTFVKFDGIEIPNYKKIKESVERLANFFPYQRIIGWDFAIGKDGSPILIELNTGSGIWATQLVNGAPLFGKFSDEVLNYMKKKN